MFRITPLLFSLLFGLFLLAGTMGCSGTEQTTVKENPQQNQSELEALYWARQDSSRMNFTRADVDFMTGMIAHHAQALIMSQLAPENGASRAVQILAARIINAQKDEIETMQNWLQRRDQPVPEIEIDGLTLHIHGVGRHHSVEHHQMPGMLTQSQLEELAEAKKSEFDRLFLRYMIDHHKGAVTMVQTLFDTDGAGQDDTAFRLASDINVDQITEIERMKRMLENMTDS